MLPAMKLIDLSVPLQDGEISEPLPASIDYVTHDDEGLQQMQQFLQQVANNGSVAAAAAAAGAGAGSGPAPGFNPTQLHHLMQQQQSFLSHHQVSNIFSYYQMGFLTRLSWP